jgi:CubicO group peptidase (beta-lactamase class C family)
MQQRVNGSHVMSRPGHNRAASLLPILTMTLVGHAAAAGPGDPLPRATPESVGMSSARLAAMGEFFRTETTRDAAAGYAILVARNGKLIYSTAVGMQDRERAIPMSLDTRFRIFSMTKPVTSVAVLMLYEEGKLQLDDPVSRYLPAFAQSRVIVGVDEAGKPRTEPVKRPITVRQLLSHTSGLGYGPGYDTTSPLAAEWAAFSLYGPQTADEKISRLAALPLYFEPGSDWRYSYATDVLGHLVEVVSGMPFAEFLQKRLFEPLGMTHTGFFVSEADAGRVATIYRRNAAGKLEPLQGPFAAPPTAAPPFISGGGGLLSTAGDYLRFAQMLADKGRFEGRRYLSPVTIELMTSQQVPDAAMGKAYGDTWRGLGFGLGVSPVIDFRHVPQANRDGDYTWPGVMDTNWMVSPSTGIVAIVLAQVARGADGQANRTYQDMHNQVYQAVLEP